jgi:hypothetical protein
MISPTERMGPHAYAPPCKMFVSRLGGQVSVADESIPK